jgi:methyl-accepting chemotaxis protein-2 (aspartate sensor receptor)
VKKLSKISLVKRLSFFQVLVILIVMGTFTFTLSSLITKRIESRAEKDLTQRVALLVNMISTYHSALAENAQTLLGVFHAGFPGEFSLVSSSPSKAGVKEVELLKSGSTTLNGNTEIVDRFYSTTHAACSVFVRSGEDFMRISSTLKDEKGNRFIGSLLDQSQPAYKNLIEGAGYTGKADIGGREYMSAYAPIKDAQGRVVGVIGILVDFTDGLQKLSEQIVKIKIGQTGYIYAMDAKPGKDQGVLRIHPSMLGKNVINSKDAHGVEFFRNMISQKQGVIRYWWINKGTSETKAREKIVAFDYIKEWDWIVAAGSYTDELNTEGVFLRNATLAATLLVVIALVSMFVIMAHRWISMPLQRAVVVTDRLAAGDFTQIASMEIDEQETENEVELLVRGIYRMAHSLCSLLEMVSDAAAQLTVASQQILASAGRSMETSQNQSSSTAQVATAMLEMAATVEEVSKNSHQAAEAARIAADTAHDGGKVVSETLANMRLIADSTNAVSAKISELGRSSDQIGSIASVISDIAGQTNLLALNAAIEAARAGEQGRGFAVVAGEVRRLAERTATATEEISGMIDSIQREAREAVEAMQGESRQVMLGVDKTESSGKALDRIIEMAGQVGEMVAQIATAATQQSAAAEEVNGNVAHIAKMTSESSENASETSRACTNLSSLALSLQSVVGQFKLSSTA